MCRRCSECANSTHHWIDNSDFGQDVSEVELADLAPELRNDAYLKLLTESEWVCKHCPALAQTCLTCDGNGDLEHEQDLDDLAVLWDEDDDDDLTCPVCLGSEVTLAWEPK